MKVRVELTFDAASCLPGHPTCGELHGHSYRCELVAAGVPKDGVLSDFRALKRSLKAALEPYDHSDLNASLGFPSLENLALALAARLRKDVPGLHSLRLWEGEAEWVELSATDAEWPRG